MPVIVSHLDPAAAAPAFDASCRSRRGRRRALLAALVAAGSCGWTALAADARPAVEPAATVIDPVYVFYPRGSCQGPELRIEVWDREAAVWEPHPQHPRVRVDTCQLEDAGILLNEIRRQCIEPPGPDPPPPWLVGLDVFDPRIMERCEMGVAAAPPDLEILLDRSGPGAVVRNQRKQLPIEGRVRVGGALSTDATVVIAIDRSGGVRRDGVDVLAAQTRAAEAFVRRHRGHLGALRIGVIAHPNMPPAPGSRGGTAARWVVSPTDDARKLSDALRRLERRGAAGVPSHSAALRFAIDEMVADGARPDAARHLLFSVDGRGGDSFGARARDDARLRAQLEELAERARTGNVALHLFSLAGLAERPPAFLEARVAPRGSVVRVLRDGLAAPFFTRVRLPWVEEVRIANLSLAPDLQPARLDAEGRFTLTVEAASGENRLLAEARLSDGRRGEFEWQVTFDDGAIRERLLEQEAARIERLRGGSVEITPELEPAPAAGSGLESAP